MSRWTRRHITGDGGALGAQNGSVTRMARSPPSTCNGLGFPMRPVGERMLWMRMAAARPMVPTNTFAVVEYSAGTRPAEVLHPRKPEKMWSEARPSRIHSTKTALIVPRTPTWVRTQREGQASIRALQDVASSFESTSKPPHFCKQPPQTESKNI